MRKHITLFLQAEAAVQAEAIELSASAENRNTGTDVALNRTRWVCVIVKVCVAAL